jgi:hypothetical protein
MLQCASRCAPSHDETYSSAKRHLAARVEVFAMQAVYDTYNARMVKVPDTLPKPPVSWFKYWLEWALILVAWLTPVSVWFYWHDGHLLARSGSVAVLFAVIGDFRFLNLVTQKHLNNAIRVRNGDAPWRLSTAATVVGIVALVTSVLGTIVWGYGDCFQTLTCPK